MPPTDRGRVSGRSGRPAQSRFDSQPERAFERELRRGNAPAPDRMPISIVRTAAARARCDGPADHADASECPAERQPCEASFRPSSWLFAGACCARVVIRFEGSHRIRVMAIESSRTGIAESFRKCGESFPFGATTAMRGRDLRMKSHGRHSKRAQSGRLSIRRRKEAALGLVSRLDFWHLSSLMSPLRVPWAFLALRLRLRSEPI